MTKDNRKSFLNLKIITVDKIFIEKTINKFYFKEKENGNLTILPRHIDYISCFNDGYISYIDIENNKYFIAVKQGVLVKVGRDIQISTMEALGNEINLTKLKEIILQKQKSDDNLKQYEKKIISSLDNIEFELLNKMRRLGQNGR